MIRLIYDNNGNTSHEDNNIKEWNVPRWRRECSQNANYNYYFSILRNVPEIGWKIRQRHRIQRGLYSH